MEAVERLFAQHKDKIAAAIIEPIAANMGVVDPEPGFLTGLREITRRNGALLIVDEVITGFRMHFGAAQELAGVPGDLTILGKIIGGGLPVAAYGGPAEIMNQVAPLGPVYQAGTLAGNPLAMRAGIATLQQLARPGVYGRINEQSARLVVGLRQALVEAGIAGRVNAVGSLMTLFFTADRVRNYGDAKRSDTKRFGRFFREMLDRGVFIAPSQFEAAFVSSAHTSEDITRTIVAARDSLQAIAAEPAG